MTVFNTPLDAPGIVEYDSAFFVQDSWTLKRLTINPGVRIEWFAPAWTRRARCPADSRRSGSSRSSATCIKWGPDYAPRFAAVYDVFGNGRTALKTSFSKYHRQYDADPFLVYADAGFISELRNWFDVDLCRTRSARGRALRPTDNDRIAQDNEIGTGSPARSARSAQHAGDLDRQYNLEFTAGVQHQVAPRLAVGVMFYKRSIKNIQLTDRSCSSTAPTTPRSPRPFRRLTANIARDPASRMCWTRTR